MRTTKTLFGIAAALMLTATLAFAADSGSSPQKVVFWNGYTGPDRATVESIVDSFNKSQSAVQIQMEISPWDSLFQKLMPAFIAGNGPDVIGYSVTRLPEYALAGRLAPLDQYLASQKNLNRSILVPGLVSASTIGGKVYGVPMAFASMVMYYNKDEFKKAGLNPDNPPKTFTELEAAWKKLLVTSNGVVTQYPQAIGIKSTVPMIPVFFWGYGADVVGTNGKSVINSPQALTALTFLRKAFIDEKVSPVGLTGQEADNLFAAGKAAIEFNGPWALTGFQSAGINVGVAEVPAGPVGRFTWGGDTVLSINADSKVKDAAATFLDYWNSYDTQKFWSQKQAFPPTRTDMAKDADLKKNPMLGSFINAASYAKIFLAGQSKAGQIDEEALVPLWEMVFLGRDDPKSALAKADTALNKILASK